MIENTLQIGDKIELSQVVFTEDGVKTSKVYVSQLLDIVDDTTVNAAVPIESSHLVPLEIGSRYDMRFFTRGGMYCCRTEVDGRFKQDGTLFLRMKLLTELKKDQRRQYFRLERIIPVSFHVITKEEESIAKILDKKDFRDDREKRILEKKLREAMGEPKLGTITNISGGGVRFVAAEKLAKDDKLSLEFYMDRDNPETYLQLEGRIVFADERRNSNQMYENRVEFLNVNRLDRERIVKFVFSEERKMRKKESGL